MIVITPNASVRGRLFTGGFLLAAALAIVLCSLLLKTPTSAQAANASPLRLGIDDGRHLFNPEVSDAEHGFWFDQTRAAGMGFVRIDLKWRSVMIDQSVAPSDATDPEDPNYDFSIYDAAVRRAFERGLDVLVTIFSTPAFAEGPGRPQIDCTDSVQPPNCAPAGTWKPDPAAFAEFGSAVATRYSGSFVPQGESEALPRVKLFEAWNEPNISQFLNPQTDDSLNQVSVSHYRLMLNAFYAAVHAVQPDAIVFGPGTAPVSPGTNEFWIRRATAPLDFIQALVCTRISDGKYLAPCEAKPRLDAFAHNAIPPRGDVDMNAPPGWPNSLIPSNFSRGVKLLRLAEGKGRLLPGDSPRREVWATEIWIGSNPPDSTAVSPGKQAVNIAKVMRLLSTAGADAVVYFKLRDHDPRPGEQCWQSQCGVGLYPDTATWPFTVADEPPKPALTAFTFPFTVERSSKSKAIAWFRPPSKGNAVIEQLVKGKWSPIAKLGTRSGVPMTTKLALTGKAKLRVRVGSRTSLVWSLSAKG